MCGAAIVGVRAHAFVVAALISFVGASALAAPPPRVVASGGGGAAPRTPSAGPARTPPVARAAAPATTPRSAPAVAHASGDREALLRWLHGPEEHARGTTTLPARYRPSATPIGEGAFKRAYAVEGDPHAVVRVVADAPWPRFLEREHALLDKLAAHGVPVPRVLAIGEVDGRPADVVERFDLASKDPDFRASAQRLLATRTAKDDLLRIRRGFESGVAVDDLQLLVNHEGHVVVADPFAVVERRADPAAWASTVRENLVEIDALLALGGHPR